MNDRELDAREPLIPIGTICRPWGKVSAIHTAAGERSYFCVTNGGSVSRIDEQTAWASLTPDVADRLRALGEDEETRAARPPQEGEAE